MAEREYDLFISYERQDAQDSSLLLYQHLANRFGENAVFRDQQKIPSGAKWKRSLKKQVLACKGFILVIGQDWSESRVQEKLRDPENWVRQEILTGLEEQKPIFPVFIRDARVPEMIKLPEEIQPALQNYNHFRFHDGPNWLKDLDRLCSDIAGQTGLTLTGKQDKNDFNSVQERLISRLDRNKEVGCVNKNFAMGKRLFLASGGDKAGFRYFAVRCALDAMRGSASDLSGYQEIALSWSRFAEPEEKPVRQSMLIADITEKLLKQDPIGRDDDLMDLITHKLRQTSQPIVLHSTVRNFGRGSQRVIDEWFDFWVKLLAQKDSPPMIAVVLFIEHGAWNLFPTKPSCKNNCQCIVNPQLGKVEHKHLKEWTETQLRKKIDNPLYRQVKKKGESLFRFPWSTRHFEEVSEAVLDVWAEASD